MWRGRRIIAAWKLLVWIAAAVVALFAARYWVDRSAVNRLPVVPSISDRQRAIRAHLTEADAAARARPRSADAVGALGIAYHAELFYPEAIACYTLAERLNPKDSQWVEFHALAESARGADSEAAAALWRSVASSGPQMVSVWWRLGDAELKAGHLDRAEDAWRRGLDVLATEPAANGEPVHRVGIPSKAYLSAGLARLALMRGDGSAAVSLLTPVVQQSPRFGLAFRLLADAYSAIGDTTASVRTARQADRLPLQPAPAEASMDRLARQSRRGTFLLQQAKDTDSTVNAAWREFLVSRALQFEPDNADVVLEMAATFRRKGRQAEALEQFRRYEQMVPGDFQAMAQIGATLGDLGRPAEAEAWLRRALGGAPDANAHYTLGVVLAMQKRGTEAVKEYQAALAIDPTHTSARNNLAAALASQGQLDEAARELMTLVSIDPDQAKAHANLGVVLAKLGRRDAARREFQEALQRDPGDPLARQGLAVLR